MELHEASVKHIAAKYLVEEANIRKSINDQDMKDYAEVLLKITGTKDPRMFILYMQSTETAQNAFYNIAQKALVAKITKDMLP